MIRTWTVDPMPDWLAVNQRWLREANLPDVEQCEATLSDFRCELVAGHSSSHMIHMNVFERAGIDTTLV